ncbi:hypothetical protein [Polaribacter glomeratus]|uniref:Uncharacterized protein n=1 Tax=Polaribacter glomeratus TaxID=102 RepID=A0A2S7WGU8_9FLAO|nr:hypothetical protein [Polaribacter glomeratus]PQJ76843.1 hypothetical protein BTO16_13310 [Polaribacter glomeratus]TXD67313.1 hypothetical protein ESX12_01605 [Polaribacter glomeratus]
MGKLNIKKALIFTLFVFSFIFCTDNKEVIDLQNKQVIIDNNRYKESETDNYTILDARLIGDVITIKISSGGCSGISWKAALIDANEILESNPVQRNIKLSLENTEMCFAIVEREFTFNIKVLKEGLSSVNLNLEGWNTQINYN